MLTVLRRRDFALLWFAGLVSLTGDWMLVVALPITVYELTGSALATGGVLIANKLSALVLGSVAGVFVDRWDRKRTMVVANLVRAPMLLLLLAVDSAERVWIVYVVAAAVSAVGQFFRPAENALLPRLVGEEHLVPANALNALNDNLSRLVGPALGGLVAAWFGLGGVVAVDAASFLVAAGMIAAIAASTQTGARHRQPDAAAVTGSRGSRLARVAGRVAPDSGQPGAPRRLRGLRDRLAGRGRHADRFLGLHRPGAGWRHAGGRLAAERPGGRRVGRGRRDRGLGARPAPGLPARLGGDRARAHRSDDLQLPGVRVGHLARAGPDGRRRRAGDRPSAPGTRRRSRPKRRTPTGAASSARSARPRRCS